MRRLYTLLTAIIVLAVSAFGYNSSTFVGTIRIDLSAMGGEVTTVENQKIEITLTSPGYCTFALYHFIFGDMGDVGDIVIENVALGETDNGDITFKGSKKDLSLANGSIKVDVALNGNENPQGYIVMNIDVSMVNGLIKIPVTFEGSYDQPELPGTTDYVGSLAVYTTDTPTTYSNQTLSITSLAENLCIISVNDFKFNGLSLGDIVIENVSKTTDTDGTISYQSNKESLSLAGGSITADVTCQGTEKDGTLTMKIDMVMSGLTIPVVFTGTDASGICSVVNDTDCNVKYFRINGTQADGNALTPGLYIRQQGSHTSKVIIR